MNKKNLWSLLAIMMVSVLSFGFVACSDDDDDDKKKDEPAYNEKGTYTLDYKVTSYGNLDSSEKEALNYIMENLICNGEWEDATLDEVIEDVKATIKDQEKGVSETFYGKNFSVEIYIKNDKKVTVKTITVNCNGGRLVY